MKFNYRFDLPASAGEAWDKMQDYAAVMKCLPGVEEVSEKEEGYGIRVATGIGPVRLRMNGNVKLEANARERFLSCAVSMSDARSGGVQGRFDLRLEDEGEGGAMALEADVVVAGKLGEFAQPLMKRKADQIVRGFADNLKEFLQSQDG